MSNEKGYCKRILSDGKYCYHTTESPENSFCYIHSLNVVNNGERNLLEHYINSSKNENRVCLSYMKFEGFQFDKELFELITSKNKNLYFRNCQFNSCSFFGTHFFRNISFDDSYFKNTIFSQAVFTGDSLNFDRVTFEGKLPVFDYCTFEPDTVISFYDSIFDLNNIPFTKTYIRTPKVIFINTIINSERFYILSVERLAPLYDKNYLSIKTDAIFFTAMKFQGHFEYTNGKSTNVKNPPALLFQNINFSQMKSASLINANLEKARFTFSKIDEIYFLNPRWADDEKNYDCIYDELSPSKDVEIEEVLRLYTQLKQNYESNRDFILAGHWFYKELNIRKKIHQNEKLKTFKQKFLNNMVILAIDIYYKISSYGQNFVKPLALLVFFLILFSPLYMIGGFTYNKVPISFELDFTNIRNFGYCYYVEYNIFTETNFLSNLFSSFLYSCSTLFLNLNRNFESASKITNLFQIAHYLINITIVPLFFLALRRRFRNK